MLQCSYVSYCVMIIFSVYFPIIEVLKLQYVFYSLYTFLFSVSNTIGYSTFLLSWRRVESYLVRVILLFISMVYNFHLQFELSSNTNIYILSTYFMFPTLLL